LLPAIEVSEADVKRGYEDRQTRYVTLERRHVQQIMFANVDEAKAAAARLAKGATFAALAADSGLKDKFTDLGTIAKSAMIDSVIAEAAFVLKTGAVSAPVEGRFGVALIHVVKIEPGQAQPLEKVAAEIKREIALERARREVQTVRDKIEDERLDGKTLTQAAEKLALKLRAIEAVDRSGRDPDGAQLASLPEGVNVLAAAFLTEAGGENEPLQVQGAGFVWFEVVSVTPSRDRPLAEIKDQVATRWRDDEITARLKTKTTEMLDKLKWGTRLTDIATASKLKLQTASGFKRGNPVAGIPLRAVSEIFRIAKDGAGVADGENATDRIVFRVTGITVPALDPASPEAKRFEEALRRAIAEDIFVQYMARLQSDIGVTVNQSALNQVTGANPN